MLFPLLALLPRGAFAVSLTGSQQNSLNFYGTIIARRYSGQNARDDGDRSYLYFGLIGKKKIAPRWRAYAHWEYTVSFATRLATAPDSPILGCKTQPSAASISAAIGACSMM
ncbi:porin [Serratia marcescens]